MINKTAVNKSTRRRIARVKINLCLKHLPKRELFYIID